MLQSGQRHSFHFHHHPPQIVGIFRLYGRQREAAVARDHRCDPVKTGRRGVGIPEKLRIVMGVGIHEARADDFPFGVNHMLGFVGRDAADGGNAVAADGDVGLMAWAARAVYESSASDEIVVHLCRPF